MEGFGDFDNNDGFTNQNEDTLQFSTNEPPVDPFMSAGGMSMSNQNN